MLKSLNFLNLALLASFSTMISCRPSDMSGVTIIDSEAGDPESVLPTTVLMNESFERNELIVAPDQNNAFGWKGFIWDYGTPVIGSSGANVAAIIMGEPLMGQSSDGQRALYMYGREGASIHSIFLYTRPYDLTNFGVVRIKFDYLTFGLNDADDTEPEFLKLDVCANTLDNCGVGATPNYTKMKGANWVTLVNADPRAHKNNLNGKNHRSTDWAAAEVQVDISQFVNRDKFTFRFNAKMSDGFIANNKNNPMVDGAAVDNIRVEAVSLRPDSGGRDTGSTTGGSSGGATGGDGSNCDPNLPYYEPRSCNYISF